MSNDVTRKFGYLAIGALLVIACLIALRPSTSTAQSSVVWRAEYFDNMNLTGTAVAVVDESEVNHRWQNHGPGFGIGPHYFSVRWSTAVNLPAGVYLFKAYVDDGVRVYVDGKLLINQWQNQPETLYQQQVTLEGGSHTMRVEYYQHIGDATAIVWWEWLTGSVTPQWRAEYYNNPYLVGAPVLVRDEGGINYDWGTASPAPSVAADNFSARWTGNVYFGSEGIYTFTLTVDDGARLWVDGGLLVDMWNGQAGQSASGSRFITLGVHPVIMEYYENSGDARVGLAWSSSGTPVPSTTPVPTSVPTATQPTTPSGEIIIDNLDAGFQKSGPASSWYYRYVGYKGHTYWTYNSDSTLYNYGQWTPQLPGAGNYNVYTFIPKERADTQNAQYRIRHNGQDVRVAVNQSIYFDQWVSLGTHYFSGLGNEYVYLDDVTGEVYASRKIAFDAVKFVPSGAVQPTSSAAPTQAVATATSTQPVAPTATQVPTSVPATPTPTLPACSITPILGFGEVWKTNTTVSTRLGCPVELETSTWSAEESFIGGYMFWRGDLRLIYALYSNGTWQSFVDTWNEGDLEWDGTIVPPSGYYQPVRGFGKIWREQPGVRDKLSWATNEERGFNGSWQAYQGGLMLWSDDLGIFVLYNDGTWSRYL